MGEHMRFLFVNPTRSIAKDNIWSIVKSSTPPIGLAILTAVLEQQGVHSDIIDAQALQFSPEEVVEQARSLGGYDIVGFSATTPEFKNAAHTAALFRKAFPNSRILFGGVHSTIFHEDIVAAGVADMVIRGEGEESILALALSSDLDNVPNLTWKDESGTIVVNKPSDKPIDLDTLPFPAYHKLPMKHYRSALGAAKRSPSIGIITSRGCPGACTFCYSGMFGNTIRYISADNVYDHICFLQEKYGIREISFYDDTFTYDRNRIMDLCARIIDGRINLSWSCFARVDTVDLDLLKTMRRAGCHQIMYGFETGNDKALHAINKRVTSGRYESVVNITREAGINIRGAFMLGIPGETEQSLIETITLAKRLSIQFAIFNITTPYPGTALYNWAEKSDLLIHRNWEDYDYAHPLLALPTLPPKVLVKHYKYAYQTFYLRPAYLFWRLPGVLSGELLSVGWKVLWGLCTLLTSRREKVGVS